MKKSVFHPCFIRVSSVFHPCFIRVQSVAKNSYDKTCDRNGKQMAVSSVELLAAAEEAARVAGAVLQEWAGKFTVREKAPADLVTEADLEAQNAIHEFLQTRFPDHGFLGEEGLQEGSGESGFRWVIDPLDGTSNYVHRYPAYAVSIGLEKDGELVVGVVYDPCRDEMFSARLGEGATLNGEAIQASRTNELRLSMLVASFPPGVDPKGPAIARFLRVLPHAQTIHRTGSAALNFAYIATGRMEGYWSTNLKPWDMAAGALIVSEAGGRVTTTTGTLFDIETPDVLATNGTAIHAQLQELLT